MAAGGRGEVFFWRGLTTSGRWDTMEVSINIMHVAMRARGQPTPRKRWRGLR